MVTIGSRKRKDAENDVKMVNWIVDDIFTSFFFFFVEKCFETSKVALHFFKMPCGPAEVEINATLLWLARSFTLRCRLAFPSLCRVISEPSTVHSSAPSSTCQQYITASHTHKNPFQLNFHINLRRTNENEKIERIKSRARFEPTMMTMMKYVYVVKHQLKESRLRLFQKWFTNLPFNVFFPLLIFRSNFFFFSRFVNNFNCCRLLYMKST